MKTHDVISIGSTNLDLFIHSKAFTIKKNTACLPIGDKLLIDQCCTEVGGSATNSATTFRSIGLRAGIISKLGQDPYAEVLKKHFKKHKITFMGKQAKGNTGLSIILTGLKKDRTILVNKGNNNDLTVKDIPKQPNAKWYYFGSALDKMWKTQCHLADYAKNNNINILFNPSHYVAKQGMRALKPVLDATTILIVNHNEAQALTKTKANIKTLLKKLQQNIPLVVITDGKKGAYAYNGITMYKLIPKQVNIVDTTGAGDAFASGFLAAVIYNKDINTALKWGAAQANNIIQHYGSTNNTLNKNQIMKQTKTAGRVTEV